MAGDVVLARKLQALLDPQSKRADHDPYLTVGEFEAEDQAGGADAIQTPILISDDDDDKGDAEATAKRSSGARLPEDDQSIINRQEDKDDAEEQCYKVAYFHAQKHAQHWREIWIARAQGADVNPYKAAYLHTLKLAQHWKDMYTREKAQNRRLTKSNKNIQVHKPDKQRKPTPPVVPPPDHLLENAKPQERQRQSAKAKVRCSTIPVPLSSEIHPVTGKPLNIYWVPAAMPGGPGMIRESSKCIFPGQCPPPEVAFQHPMTRVHSRPDQWKPGVIGAGAFSLW